MPLVLGVARERAGERSARPRAWRTSAYVGIRRHTSAYVGIRRRRRAAFAFARPFEA
ncbi:acetyltransferase [Burkholderia pseudomallei]|nr:acetyltransferase [Burkholderia pseudomallei]